MASVETINTRIAEAEDARHRLSLGESVVEVWRDGRRVQYSEVSLPQLDAYIERLKGELVTAQAAAGSAPPPRRRSAIGTCY